MKPGMVGGGHLTAALRQGPVGGMRSDPVTPRIRRRTMPAAKIFCAQIRAPDTRRATKIFSQPHPRAGGRRRDTAAGRAVIHRRL
ncbi:hypothetical protein C357_11194 [Citreicella sp. 357]|nr:hypothetical protein C357_11194 [Citreicella sp. 357]